MQHLTRNRVRSMVCLMNYGPSIATGNLLGLSPAGASALRLEAALRLAMGGRPLI